MAFTFGDSDFSSIFGGMGPMGASPALGRLLQQKPEALLPTLIASGIEPPPDQSAEPTGQLHSAPPIPMMPGAQAPVAPPTTDPLVPPSIPMAGQPVPGLPEFSTNAIPQYPASPLEVPGGVSPSGKPNYGPMQERIDYVKNLLGGFGLPVGPPTTTAASPQPMAPGANTPSDWYDSPQQEQPAPGIPLPPARPQNLGESVSAKGGGGKGGGKAAGSKEAVGDAAKKLTDALSGVRAPAAPPQPQLRPEVARAGAAGGGSQNNPLVTLLTALLAGGGGQGGNAPYRLNQAVGGKIV